MAYDDEEEVLIVDDERAMGRLRLPEGYVIVPKGKSQSILYISPWFVRM